MRKKKHNRTSTDIPHQQTSGHGFISFNFTTTQAVVLWDLPDFVKGRAAQFTSSPGASDLHGMQGTPANRFLRPTLLFFSRSS